MSLLATLKRLRDEVAAITPPKPLDLSRFTPEERAMFRALRAKIRRDDNGRADFSPLTDREFCTYAWLYHTAVGHDPIPGYCPGHACTDCLPPQLRPNWGPITPEKTP